MGPGAGSAGGRVAFSGTPQEMIDEADTVTAQYLKSYVS
ncbi:P-loop containing nucleoside triphosphate hydrolase [Corynebacterium pseudotuberculosis]|nr:P-loop containing nucleoside triphosphate hydrolase [Corynebacterium pseudotuberculosis]